MKDYMIENYGKGVIVADYSGNRGEFGAAFAGKNGVWKDQPVNIEPFSDEETAKAFAEAEVV